MPKPRILHCITVYNGRAFVPRAIESAMRLDQDAAEIDVLVLDDASPEPGWSGELEAVCGKLGARYYRSPRNLGIPRNCSLGMLTAEREGYDYVVINNSDVIFPRNLIGALLAALDNPGVGSVTAWSNNVSIYSLLNDDPDFFLADQAMVDEVSETLAERYAGQVLDMPAGISFCIMMSTDMVREIGVMDPIFGRGYCEELDWSLRALAAGYRNCLATGCYVYHQGRGSNLAAGLVSAGHTTVPENEAIIDYRYPEFRRQVQAFVDSGAMGQWRGMATRQLIDAGAQRRGYSIELGWLPAPVERDARHARVTIMPDGSTPQLRYSYNGFTETARIAEADVAQTIRRRFGSSPTVINLYDRSKLLSQLTAVLPADVRVFRNYPSTL